MASGVVHITAFAPEKEGIRLVLSQICKVIKAYEPNDVAFRNGSRCGRAMIAERAVPTRQEGTRSKTYPLSPGLCLWHLGGARGKYSSTGRMVNRHVVG